MSHRFISIYLPLGEFDQISFFLISEHRLSEKAGFGFGFRLVVVGFDPQLKV